MEKSIEEARTKLVSKNSPDVCFGHLSFSKATVSVSQTGTCTVSASVFLHKPMLIFDDVNAVIDGSVNA